MWKVPQETQQSKSMANKILTRKTNTEKAKYLHASMFIATTSSFIKKIEQGFLKTWPDITET